MVCRLSPPKTQNTWCGDCNQNVNESQVTNMSTCWIEVGKRYKVARPLDLWSGEPLDRKSGQPSPWTPSNDMHIPNATNASPKSRSNSIKNIRNHGDLRNLDGTRYGVLTPDKALRQTVLAVTGFPVSGCCPPRRHFWVRMDFIHSQRRSRVQNERFGLALS